MRRILTILLLTTSLMLSAGTYYVATTGSDAAAGTIAAPWATWNYAFNQLVAGDTLYIRGGTYQPIGTFSDAGFGDTHSAVSIHNINGTAENRIVVMGYPGERAILDGLNVTQGADTTSRHGIKVTYCDYWTFKNFEITGFVQLPDQLGVAPFQVQEYSDNNEFIQLRIYYNGGSGLRILYDCTGNYIYNCDIYNNYDPLSDPSPGNNSDGIEIADITDTAAVNTIRGCRIWDNSDDGIDLMRNEGIVIIDSCWAFYNGVTADYQATGIKLGWVDADPVTYQREVTNCISAYNMNGGFVNNNCNAKSKIYNNLSIGNGWHGFTWYNARTNGESIMRNNISINNDSYQYSYIDNFIEFDHNNWDAYFDQTGPVVTEADFVTMDTLGLRYSRKSNGCLPDILFGRLAETSGCIDAGVDVGIDYTGTAPDLGPFEYSETYIPTGTTLGTGTGNNLLVDKNGRVIIIQ